MWALENDTPFSAGRKWIRNREGALVWVVAVKATYTIHPDGSTELSKEQAEVELVPKYSGKPGESSLLYESDLPLAKLGTDVLVHGYAHAPPGTVTTQIDVVLRVERVSKILRISGDRVWEKTPIGFAISEPTPFDKIPIQYERAFGGRSDSRESDTRTAWEPRNPIGTGFASRPEDALGLRLPNVESKREMIDSWHSRPEPAGFGPISPDWSPRVEFAGTYDEDWQKNRFPLLPNDFSERFFQCAPPDQQLQKFLRGGELIELTNMTPNGALRFTLPKIRLGFETYFAGTGVRHGATLHTLVIEPDVSRIILVWHTALQCHSRAMRLDRTAIRQKRYINLTSNGGRC